MILLTGFPGFIGERLLPRLLETHTGDVACLVQEKFLQKAREALKGVRPGRVSLAIGDITEEGLGISNDEASRLRSELTKVFHLAAVYDLAVSRDLANRVNIVGTKNVLKFLAGAKRFERLHYVSTAYVSGWAKGVFRETDLDVGQSFKNHYEETKFLAEVAVVQSGLPTTIYRPGIVVGDSRNGETGKFDGPYFALKAMERIPSPGVFLRVGSGNSPINLVPVDFVIEALARLSALKESLGRTYHLTDPTPLSVLQVERLFARSLGKKFAYFPVPRPMAKLLFRPKVIQRYFGMPRETFDYFDHPCHYDCSGALKDLGPLGLSVPPLEGYVGRLVDFYKAESRTVRREAMV